MGLSALSSMVGGRLADSGPLAGQGWQVSAVRGAVSSAVSQGIGVALGMQSKFSWAGVAAAGVSAGVGAAVGASGIGTKEDPGWMRDWNAHAQSLVTGGAAAAANAATRSLIEGTDFGDNLIAALPDVIGQTIGQMVGESVSKGIDQNRLQRLKANAVANGTSMKPTFVAGTGVKSFQDEIVNVEILPDGTRLAWGPIPGSTENWRSVGQSNRLGARTSFYNIQESDAEAWLIAAQEHFLDNNPDATIGGTLSTYRVHNGALNSAPDIVAGDSESFTTLIIATSDSEPGFANLHVIEGYGSDANHDYLDYANRTLINEAHNTFAEPLYRATGSVGALTSVVDLLRTIDPETVLTVVEIGLDLWDMRNNPRQPQGSGGIGIGSTDSQVRRVFPANARLEAEYDIVDLGGFGGYVRRNDHLDPRQARQLRNEAEFHDMAMSPPPNSTIRWGNYMYRTDSQGRVVETFGRLRINPAGRPHPDVQARIGREGVDGDVGFHLFGDRFGGTTDRLNVIPGNGRPSDGLVNLNGGDYKRLENEWATALSGRPPQRVEVRHNLQYSDASNRPSSIRVEYRIGNGGWQSRNFDNAPQPRR